MICNNVVVMESGKQSSEYSINWNLIYDGSYYEPRKSAAAGEVVSDYVHLMMGTGDAKVVTADGVTIPSTVTVTSTEFIARRLDITFVMPASDVVISDV